MRMAMVVSVIGSALLGVVSPARGEAEVEKTVTSVSVLTLDSLSHVSFDDRVVVPIPAGGTIRFRCYAHGDGESVALRAHASDFSSLSLSLPSGQGKVELELLRPAKGFMRTTPGGDLHMEFEIAARVSTEGEKGTRVQERPIRFTTESLETWNATGTKRLDVNGLRVNAGSRVVQLVAKMTAGPEDPPVPGAAVYIVLSGILDRLPTF